MFVSELFLSAIVYTALCVSSVTPLVLLFLFFKDVMKKSLW